MFPTTRSRLLTLASTLVLLLSASACEKAESGPPKLDPAKFNGVGEVGKVELVSAGSGDKRELRFVFQEGKEERVRFGMEMKSKTAVNGGDMQFDMGMNYLMSSKTEELKGDRARMGFVIEDFQIDKAKTTPMLVQGLGGMAGIMNGMRGSMELDPRGQIHEVGYDMSSVPPAMREALSQMQDGLKQISTSFPEEPVGVGATWRLYQRLKSRGFEIRQQVDVTLVKIDGSAVHLDTKIVQDAEMQLAEMAGMPAGAKAQVSAFGSTGTGQMVLDLNGFVPVHVNMDLATKGKFTLDMGADPMTMKMDAKINVSVDRI